MARKMITKETLEKGIVDVELKAEADVKLTEMVNEFVELKTKADEYDKKAKELNAKLKKEMKERGIDSAEGEDFIVNLSVQNRDTFDEAPMIKFMEEQKVANWTIHTKKFIDMEELEKAIYNGDISQENMDELQKFRIHKSVDVLKMKKKGGK